METITLYTIGHSNHEFDALLALLKQHGIEQVVDVRSSPYSRYVPQANREVLAHSLRAAGIDYQWMGDRLGGKPDGVVADYDQLRASQAFQEGIADVLALAGEQRTALMCSEGDHRQCHRHKLLTPALFDIGAEVLHIQPDGSPVKGEKEAEQLTLF